MNRQHPGSLLSLLLLSLMASLAATACDPTPKPTAAPRVSACSLFTSADAEAVLGEGVNFMTSVLTQEKGDPAQCGYNAGSDTTRVVSLELRQAASADQARRLFDSAKSLLAGAEDVPGLGQGAFWQGRGVEQLHIVQSDLHLIITAHPGPDHDAKAAAQAIAQKVLARL